MAESFDPYHRWLGIPPKQQPPNYYRLLGLELFEEHPDVVRDAADQRMAHVRTYQLGQYAEYSQTILNELAAARACLLDPDKKAQYDREVRAEITATQRIRENSAPPIARMHGPAAAQVAVAPKANYRGRRKTANPPWPRYLAALSVAAFLVILAAGPLRNAQHAEHDSYRQTAPELATGTVANRAALPDGQATSPASSDFLPDRAVAETFADTPGNANAPSETGAPAVGPRTPTESGTSASTEAPPLLPIGIAENNIPLDAVPTTDRQPTTSSHEFANGDMAPGYSPESAKPVDMDVDIANAESSEQNVPVPFSSGFGTDSASGQVELLSTGTGADGPIIVRDRYEVDSVKTSLSQPAASGTTTVAVDSSIGFQTGDEVLVIAMRGTGAGRHEFQRIASVKLTSIELTSPLVNHYDPAERAFLQRVPNFTDVTVEAGGRLTASPWNGSTGGIVVLRADGVVSVGKGGSIGADALGFRGGAGEKTATHADGCQGESYLGSGVQGNRSPNGGGGGAGVYAARTRGGFVDWGCGGGGGSYASYGSNGFGMEGYGVRGEPYGNDDPSRLLPGSGGGSGAADDDGDGSSTAGHGGAGGGIVLIAARSLELLGSLSARGADGHQGVNAPGEGASGGGGGGSGGFVLLALETPPSRSRLAGAVQGGNGGAGWCRGGNGGDGFLVIRRITGRSSAQSPGLSR